MARKKRRPKTQRMPQADFWKMPTVQQRARKLKSEYKARKTLVEYTQKMRELKMQENERRKEQIRSVMAGISNTAGKLKKAGIRLKGLRRKKSIYS